MTPAETLSGWDTPGANAAGWRPVLLGDAGREQQMDVTAPAAALVQGRHADRRRDNKIAGDPAYHTAKQLRVDYTLGGVAHTQTVERRRDADDPRPRRSARRARHPPCRLRRAGRQAARPPALVAHVGPPVRVTQYTAAAPDHAACRRGPISSTWARTWSAGRGSRFRGPAGTEVRLRFGEILNPDGTLYTTNLRSARATDTYICRGGGRRDLGAALHVPRLPLRRGDRLPRQAGPGRDHRLRRRLGHAAGGDVRLLAPDGQPAPAQHRLGPARQLSERPDGLPAARRAPGLDGRRPDLRPDGHLQPGRGGVLREVDAGRRRRPVRRRAAFPTSRRASWTRRRRPRLGRCGHHRPLDGLPGLRRHADLSGSTGRR